MEDTQTCEFNLVFMGQFSSWNSLSVGSVIIAPCSEALWNLSCDGCSFPTDQRAILDVLALVVEVYYKNVFSCWSVWIPVGSQWTFKYTTYGSLK